MAGIQGQRFHWQPKAVPYHILSQPYVLGRIRDQHHQQEDASLVNPPEVLKGALLCNATFMILCHCHPSSTAIPSADDRKVTRRMVEVGELMGIKVIDHIKLGDGDAYFSFKDAHRGYGKREGGIL